MNSLYFEAEWVVAIEEWQQMLQLFELVDDLSSELVIVPHYYSLSPYITDHFILKVAHHEDFNTLRELPSPQITLNWSRTSETHFSHIFAFDPRKLKPYELRTWLARLQVVSQQNNLHYRSGVELPIRRKYGGVTVKNSPW